MCTIWYYDITVEKFADMVEERLMKEIDADVAEEEKVSNSGSLISCIDME